MTPANNAPEFSDGASTTRSVAENTAASSNVGLTHSTSYQVLR